MSSTEFAVSENMGFYKLAPEQFDVAVKEAISNYKDVIAAVKSNNSVSWETFMQPLEEAAEELDRVWRLLDHLNAVDNTPEIRAVYDNLLPIVSNFQVDICQDQQLYKLFLAMSHSDEFVTLEVAQQTLINNVLRDCELSGVALEPLQREEYKKLSERLSDLENKFSNNVLDSTEDWTYHVDSEQEFLLDGIPAHTLALAATKATAQNLSGWILTIDSPCCTSVLKYADNIQLREEFYIAYSTRASKEGAMSGSWDNTPLIAEILHVRQQLAHLVGHDNYAEYSLVPKMARSVSLVKSFLNDLSHKARPQALREFEELNAFAKQQGFTQALQAWDFAYYSEKLRQQKFNVSEEELRQYFPEPKVLNGMFKVVKKLFGIDIEEVSDFIAWNSAVRMFKVTDQDDQLRGHFYVDLYTREGKRGGAWMSECMSRIRFADDLLQTPIAYLNCNFAPPLQGQPGLLSHGDVETLFHEFGHTLHHVLSKVDYYGVSGMNGVAWDAVELPSQFMENWAWEWQVIQDISENINTGEHLPREKFDQLLASKNFQSALHLIRQLEFSLFDLRIHENSRSDVGRTAHEIMQSIRKEVGVLPTTKINRFENSFSHIFAGGYAAGYYSYLWAEVLSCDAYDKFKEESSSDNDLGNAFLVHILEKGGSLPAMDLFVAFAGREPMVDALLRHHAIY